MQLVWQLFFAFLRVGIFGYGGGPSFLPLIEAEAVDKFNWLSTEEFTDMLAFANSLPGPVATKSAIFIGYKTAGYPGIFASLLGLLLPSSIAILALGTVYLKYKDTAWMTGMLKAVRPVIVVMLAMVAVQMAPKSFLDVPTYIIGIIALGATVFFNVHPAIQIAVAIIFGYFYFGVSS